MGKRRGATLAMPRAAGGEAKGRKGSAPRGAPLPPKGRKLIESHPIMAWAREHPEEAIREARAERYARDTILTRILEGQGQARLATPLVLSDREINDHVARGAQEWFHGFASERGRQYANQFMHGAFVPGRGSFGAGFYTGNGYAGLGEAHGYTATSQTGEYHPGSVIMRGVMLPGARIYPTKALNRDINRDRAAYLRAHPEPMSPAEKAVLEIAYEDPGRYAALKGYDMIGDHAGWGLIVSREHVAVSRRLIPSLRSPDAAARRGLGYRIGKRFFEEKGRMTRAREKQIRAEEEAKFAAEEEARRQKFASDLERRTTLRAGLEDVEVSRREPRRRA